MRLEAHHRCTSYYDCYYYALLCDLMETGCFLNKLWRKYIAQESYLLLETLFLKFKNKQINM